MRFHSKAVRLTGAVLFVLTHCVYMGIAMFAPATAFDAGEYTEYVGKGRLIQHDKKHKIRNMECTLFPGGGGGGGGDSTPAYPGCVGPNWREMCPF